MNSRKALEVALMALESDRKKMESHVNRIDDNIVRLRMMIGRPAGRKSPVAHEEGPKRKPFTIARKKALSKKMKAVWAKRKAASG